MQEGGEFFDSYLKCCRNICCDNAPKEGIINITLYGNVIIVKSFFYPDFKSLKEEITIHIFFSIKGRQKVENGLTHVTSGVWSHSHFSARINSTREQLFRADELPKMALERKKQTGSCLTFFQMQKQTLISWS